MARFFVVGDHHQILLKECRAYIVVSFASQILPAFHTQHSTFSVFHHHTQVAQAVTDKLVAEISLSVFTHVVAFIQHAPYISAFLGTKVKDDLEFCTYMLENYHIAIVPGSAFGAPGCVRFSYANSMENLVKGIKRFKEGLKSL